MCHTGAVYLPMMEDTEETKWPEDGTAGGEARRQLSPDERAKASSSTKWRRDNSGVLHPPPLQDRFLDEYCLVPEQMRPTQKEWAERNGVSERAVTGWKRDQRFIDEWNRRMSLTWGHPDNLNGIINNLMEQAKSSSGTTAIKAAELWLKFMGLMAPPEMNVNVTATEPDVATMSTLELVELTKEMDQLES